MLIYKRSIRPHGQAVKTLPSQGKITSSILVGATKLIKKRAKNLARFLITFKYLNGEANS